MAQAKLSVIMPNYNDATYLAESVDAILTQSYKPYEFIIIDDASTDNSIEIIEQYTRRGSTIRLLRNESNQGVVHSVNRALALCRGDYLYFASSNDRILPGFFQKSMTLLEKYPAAGICRSEGAELIGGEVYLIPRKIRPKSPGYYPPDRLAELMFLSPSGWLGTYSVIFKRAALAEIGYFIPSLQSISDSFAALVIGFRHGACLSHEHLCAERILPQSYSRSLKNWSSQSVMYQKMLQVLKTEGFRDTLPLFKKSGVLASFGLPMLRVLITKPAHRDLLSTKMIGYVLKQIARLGLSRITPGPLKNIYRRRRLKGR